MHVLGMRLTVGSQHTLGLNDDGTVYAWGSNDVGQTGGSKREQPNPNNVLLPDDKRAKAVSCRNKTSMALATDGSLFVWGGNENSLIGVEGKIWGWGSNLEGQVGNSKFVSALPLQEVTASFPSKPISIVCGSKHSLALLEDGSVFSWGKNTDAQLGIPDGGQRSPTPRKIEALKDIATISSYNQHNLALTKQGTCWSWGDNSKGQLGVGNQERHSTPVLITIPEEVITVACGYLHSAALGKSGTIYTWGNNEAGELGIAGPDLISKPTVIPSVLATSIYCGLKATIAHNKEQAKTWCWGEAPGSTKSGKGVPKILESYFSWIPLPASPDVGAKSKKVVKKGLSNSNPQNPTFSLKNADAATPVKSVLAKGGQVKIQPKPPYQPAQPSPYFKPAQPFQAPQSSLAVPKEGLESKKEEELLAKLKDMERRLEAMKEESIEEVRTVQEVTAQSAKNAQLALEENYKAECGELMRKLERERLVVETQRKEAEELRRELAAAKREREEARKEARESKEEAAQKTEQLAKMTEELNITKGTTQKILGYAKERLEGYIKVGSLDFIMTPLILDGIVDTAHAKDVEGAVKHIVQFHLSRYDRLRIISGDSKQKMKKLLRHHRSLKDREFVPMADDLLYSLFKLEELLGNGGEGVVFRATYKTEQVAVKQFSTLNGKNEVQLTLVCSREELLHPHIVKAIAGSTKYLILELAPEKSLKDYIHKNSSNEAFAKPILFEILMDICLGMNYLHSLKLVHRDLKPANVLVFPDPTRESKMLCKVCDFGCGKVLDKERSNTVKGTPKYQAIETYDTNYDSKRCDSWSFAMIAADLLYFPLNPDTFPQSAAPEIPAKWADIGRNDFSYIAWRQEFTTCMLESNQLDELVRCVSFEPKERLSFWKIMPRLEEWRNCEH